MNAELRRKELKAMKVADLKALAAEYQVQVSGKKSEIVEQILELELEYDANNNEESEAEKATNENPVWWNLVCRMNSVDGAPVVYKNITDRPQLQQILLHVCKDLILDADRAVKATNGDKTVKQFGPVFVSKKHKALCMKDAMAKGAVKSAAEKVLTKEQQKIHLVFNQETKHTEFKQAVQVLELMSNAGLIVAHDTDKDYAKFYTVKPNELIAFLKAVCVA